MPVALLAASILEILTMGMNILFAALGLGLVIFFHELGHFAVAKWCGVHVERFSIGFGPVLWSRKRRETEYALSAIPFGGYVKMLGQDDMDPSQLTSEEIAEDPRAYSSKPVWQRMAIISAGVTMNVLTAVLFFGLAFGVGVEMPPAIVGDVQVGMPAWKAGMVYGDEITRINGREVNSFNDIQRGAALTVGEVVIEGVHRNGETYEVVLTPDASGSRRLIGVRPATSLEVWNARNDEIALAAPGSPAYEAGFEPGDIIRRINETEVSTHAEFREFLARNRDEKLTFYVARNGKTDNSDPTQSPDEQDLVQVSVEPNAFRTLGVWMDIGKIVAVEAGSPAAREGLRAGDKITEVNGMAVGTEIDPLRLPDYFDRFTARQVEVSVLRPVEGGEPEEITVRLTPDGQPAWVETPWNPDSPLSIPSSGIAYHLIPVVLKVEEGSPAARAGIQPGDRAKEIELYRPEDAVPDLYYGKEPAKVSLDRDKSGNEVNNWAYAFWMMQEMPDRLVRLTLTNAAGEGRTVELTPWSNPDDPWFSSQRGFRFYPLLVELEAETPWRAVQIGVAQTGNTIVDIYLTLRNLVSGLLSWHELQGPIGIAKIAYHVAGQGLADLLLFLGLLSINLAVLNFLPIPVLDGGHMVFLCWEAVMRRRPSERVMIAATYFGMAFVLGLIILVIYLDIFVHGMG